jgi:hypothetical protein
MMGQASERLQRLLREPLLHFALLGAAIFIVHSVISPGRGRDAQEIVISQGDLASMTEAFVRTRMRGPTPDELNGMISDWVQDEVYAREAMALGLDQGDQIIRRRLRQKMEFLSQGLAAPGEPTDAELQDYLDRHPDDYSGERRFSFRQVYLDPARHASTMAANAARLLTRLKQAGGGASLGGLGDPFMLEQEYDSTALRELRGLFGVQFAAALDSLPTGEWAGPVASSYGVHLVYLLGRDGGKPPLTLVRSAVHRDWLAAQERERAAGNYQALLQKYTVRIDTLPPPNSASDRVGAR